MSSQALLTIQDVQESEESSIQVDSSSETLPFIRDLESIGRPYEIQDEAKCLRYTQNSCAAFSSTDSTATEANAEENVEPIYRPKPILLRTSNLRPQDRFVSLQKWEGVVLAIEQDSFLARLLDLSQGTSEEEGEFSIDDVSEEDRLLLKPGAIFYWNIGYHDSRTGQRRKVSEIRFRRLPAWTAREIEAAEREARRLRALIGWK